MSDNRDISLLLKVTIYFYFEKVRKVRKSDVLKSYHFCYNYPMWQIVISCLSLLHEPTAFSLLLIWSITWTIVTKVVIFYGPRIFEFYDIVFTIDVLPITKKVIQTYLLYEKC